MIILFFACDLRAQNGIFGNPEWHIKPAINAGFVMVHRENIGHLIQGYPTTLEINVSKPSLGNKLWQLENNLPEMGVTFQVIDFKNSQQLGLGYAMAPYIEIPLNKKEKNTRVILRLCWGAAHITNNFDLASNHKNNAIGSHLNAYVQFKWFWQMQLTKHISFEPGVSFSHASNGKAKNPNLGLNMANVSAAVCFKIPTTKQIAVAHIDSSTKVKSKNELFTFAAVGVNQRSIGSPLLNTFVYSLAYQRNVRNTHKFSGGLDIFYDENYSVDFENVFQTAPSGLEKLRISARAGYSYNVGRLSFPIELGYYVYQKTNPDANMVSRIGVRYYSKCGLVGHFGLRTHFAVAYNFEYGLGYRFFL